MLGVLIPPTPGSPLLTDVWDIIKVSCWKEKMKLKCFWQLYTCRIAQYLGHLCKASIIYLNCSFLPVSYCFLYFYPIIMIVSKFESNDFYITNDGKFNAMNIVSIGSEIIQRSSRSFSGTATVTLWKYTVAIRLIPVDIVTYKWSICLPYSQSKLVAWMSYISRKLAKNLFVWTNRSCIWWTWRRIIQVIPVELPKQNLSYIMDII